MMNKYKLEKDLKEMMNQLSQSQMPDDDDHYYPANMNNLVTIPTYLQKEILVKINQIQWRNAIISKHFQALFVIQTIFCMQGINQEIKWDGAAVFGITLMIVTNIETSKFIQSI